MDFIPANESTLFKRIFRTYVRLLFSWRFKNVWIRQAYHPKPDSRTIYFLNHTSWWDGLIPFLLNEYRFYQNARAFMKAGQMKKYPFFKWMGVFSIDANNRTHTLRSLRYAVQSMQRERSSLYIYPQGDIKPVTHSVSFKPGLGWLCSQLKGIDVVPVGIHIQSIRHNKPELHLWIDEPIDINSKSGNQQITTKCEQTMEKMLQQLVATAGFDDQPYKRF